MIDLLTDAQECMPVMTGKCYRNAVVSSEFEDKVRIEVIFFRDLGVAPIHHQKECSDSDKRYTLDGVAELCLLFYFTHYYGIVQCSKGQYTRQTIVLN